MIEDLPENILKFLNTYIDSIEQLRILLLLHSFPDRVWTTAEITAELRSTDTSVVKRLDDLYSRKVLSRVPDSMNRHQFNPISVDLKKVIGELAVQNQLRPYRVIEAIYSQPSKALQQFADAFKLKGDDS